MNATIQKCPMCAEQIPADAVLCPYCGTRLGENAQAAPLPSAPAVVVSPPTRKSRTGLWIAGALVVGIILCGAVVVVLWPQRFDLPLASNLFASPTPTATPTLPPTITPTRTPRPTLTHSVTATETIVQYIPVSATAKDFYDYATRWGQPGLLLGRPEQMINGIINQEWQTDGWAGNAHQDLWVSFDLGTLVNINSIVVYSAEDRVYKYYYVQRSPDGAAWTNILDHWVTTASGDITTLTFESIQTRYIRFVNINTSPDNNPSFTEVQFFDNPAAP